MRTPFLDNDFVRTVFKAPESSCRDNEVCLRLIADGVPALGRIPTDRGLGGDAAPWLRALKSGVLEFSFKSEYAYDYGMPQWLAGVDHAMSGLHLERLFLGRHKAYHFRVWYRDYVADYVRDLLLDSRALSRPYVERSAVDAVVHGHVSGRRNYTTELHKLISLELVHRVFVDGSDASSGPRHS